VRGEAEGRGWGIITWKNLAKRLHAPSSGNATQSMRSVGAIAPIFRTASGQAVCSVAAHEPPKKYCVDAREGEGEWEGIHRGWGYTTLDVCVAGDEGGRGG